MLRPDPLVTLVSPFSLRLILSEVTFRSFTAFEPLSQSYFM